MIKRCFLCAMVLVGATASAELQNVTIGGSIEIYGAYYSDIYESDDDETIRIPGAFLPKRPIGPYGTESFYAADGSDSSLRFVEQRTRLHVNADLTDNVRGFIEFDSIDTWGEDFRSDYITGADGRAFSGDDLEIFQSYIELGEVASQPLTLRIGRQTMTFGSGWLVGENAIPDPFTGLSFDAVRATWNPGKLTLDAWYSKLNERFAVEEDGDTIFSGLYASYAFTPDIVFDAYWMWVRDGQSFNDTNLTWETEWVENWLGYDDYDPTNLHTVGLRSAGMYNAIDWDVEAAYQFGEADSVGALFMSGGYGDNGAEFSNWAAHGDVGYTFDMQWTPRLYTHAAYYGGEDNRDLSFWEWANPFYRPDASVSFNRLFSDHELDYFYCGSALTNMWEWSVGGSVAPTESIELSMTLLYQEALEGFDRPASLRFGNWEVPLYPTWSFWTEPGEKDLGWQLTLVAAYSYSEDLSFEAGYTHLFAGEGLDDGAFIDENGLRFIGGRDNDDADILYSYAKLEF